MLEQIAGFLFRNIAISQKILVAFLPPHDTHPLTYPRIIKYDDRGFAFLFY